MTKELRVLAVGTLPPPIGGQALMFQQAIDALAERARVDTLDIQAQRNIGESGRLRFRKVAAFIALLLRKALPLRFGPSYDVLYYCPAGPNLLGLLKDIVLLSLLRPRARHSVFHFHASGSGLFIQNRAAILRKLAARYLHEPDLAIRCADVEPNDARLYHAKANCIVYNGIPDPMVESSITPRRPDDIHTLTYIGALIEDKGIFDLISIAGILKSRDLPFVLHVVGEGTAKVAARFDRLVTEHGLADCVQRRGVLTGKAKFDLLVTTDVFVFPSYFRAETQPLAIIEAQAMGVPAVAYDWRGINTTVADGESGYLVPVRDTSGFAQRVLQILERSTVQRMGGNARRHYLEHFTLARFRRELSTAVLEVPASITTRRSATV
ncbi:MAG: glycosyltransferase family 4 protein [Gemmatimonadota bacterium]